MLLKNTKYQNRIKEQFVVLKDYARLMFLTEIGIRNCVNDGVYSSSHTECQQCDLKKECRCLTEESIEYMMVENLNNIIEKMEVAKNYVERNTTHNREDDGSCYCDSCAWLAEFDRTLLEATAVTRSQIKEVTTSIEKVNSEINEVEL